MSINNIFNSDLVVKSKKASGKTASVFGLWQDKNGDNKHITTNIFGIKNEDKFIITILDNKITFIILSDKNIKKCKDNGLSVYHNNMVNGKSHNYVVIDGVSKELWDKMVKINGGVCKYKKKDIEKNEKVKAIFQNYQVVKDNEEKIKNLFMIEKKSDKKVSDKKVNK